MEQTNDAAPPGGATPDIVQIPAPASEVISARDAARSLAGFRLKAREGEGASHGEAKPAADASATVDAAPASDVDAAAAPGAPTEPAPAELPIAPPASWTKEAREQFAALPRATQEYLAAHEESREREVRRIQDDVTGQRSTLEAERAKAEQARAQYEQALPVVLANLQAQQAGDFSDIKSIIDVERLAREDWPRYVLWDAQQKRIASAEQQLAASAQRQLQERQVRLAEYVKREQGLFVEKAPEAADPAERGKLERSASAMLHELGFSDQELGELFHGHRELSLHDHRLQLLIRDGIRFRDAQKAAKEASARPVPPVQRPGVTQAWGAAQDAVVQNLTRRLDQTGNLKDAAKLLAERRKAGR